MAAKMAAEMLRSAVLRRSRNCERALSQGRVLVRQCSTASDLKPSAAVRGLELDDMQKKYSVSLERLRAIEQTPSGWVPPLDPPPRLPFHIRRSKYGALPVYIDYYGLGRKKSRTIVRRVRGDIKELEKCVRDRLGDDIVCQVNEITSQLHIKGNHAKELSRWLKEIGF